MTVTATSPLVSHVGNDATTSFPFTFKADDEDWIAVSYTNYMTGVSLNIDQDNNPGGAVEFSVAPPSGTPIDITRNIPVDQLLDYTRYGAFDSESHERALDKLTMIVQDLVFGGNTPTRTFEVTDEEIAAGAVVYDTRYPGNPEAWVERYQNPDSGNDYTAAIQTALNVMAVSGGPVAQGKIILPRHDDAQLSSNLFFDRGNVIIQGWGHEKGTKLTIQPSCVGWAIDHYRTQGRSSSVIFRDFNLDGSACDLAQGMRIENTGAWRFENVVIEHCKGGAFLANDQQDTYFDVNTPHSGSVQTDNVDGTPITETASIDIGVDAQEIVLSAVGQWENGQLIRVTGAGPGGADLTTMIISGAQDLDNPGTVNLTVSVAAETTVSGAVVKRVYYAMMFPNAPRYPDSNTTVGHNNSCRFDGRTWIERYREGAMFFYFCTDMYITVKIHGRTTSQESYPPGPDESIGIWGDRCDDFSIEHSQFVHSRKRSILWTRSGGSLDCRLTVVDNNFNSGDNYQNDDFAYIQCGPNTQGIIDKNSFANDLDGDGGDATGYSGVGGFDVLLDAGHDGFTGVNVHYTTPGGARVQNNESSKGQPIVSRSGRPSYTKGSFVPIIKGSSVDGDHTYTTQEAHYILNNGMVDVWVDIKIASVGTPTISGNLQIGNFPWVSSNDASALNVFFGGQVIRLIGMAAPILDHVSMRVNPGSAVALIENSDTDAGSTSALDETYFAAGLHIRAHIRFPIDE